MKNWKNIFFAPKPFTEQTDVEDIPTWKEAATQLKLPLCENGLNIKLWYGDLTRLRVDAVVNAANNTLRAGGGVCGALHRAAGPRLEKICLEQRGEDVPSVGTVFVTPGFDLPCDYVLHVVSPSRATDKDTFQQCYKNLLAALEGQTDAASVCFCSLGTGSHMLPVELASRWAVEAVCDYYSVHGKYGSPVIVFCCFDEADLEAYKRSLVDVLSSALYRQT